MRKSSADWTCSYWIVHSVREPGRLTRFINDFATAYLLSFAATLQILLEEVVDGAHEEWLREHESYDTRCRGLRTLRNLEAHIHAGRMTAAWRRSGNSRFRGGVDSGRMVAWQLPTIASDDLASLRKAGRKINESELGAWNHLVEPQLASDVMREDVRRLVPIVTYAETPSARVIEHT